MHFGGEFNPLEVLATAAVQRGANTSAVEGNSSRSPSGGAADNSEPVENGEDNTEDSSNGKNNNNKKQREKNLQGGSVMVSVCDVIKELKPLTVVTSSGGSVKSAATSAPSYVIKMVTRMVIR